MAGGALGRTQVPLGSAVRTWPRSRACVLALALLVPWPCGTNIRTVFGQAVPQAVVYFCPMHPHVRMHGPGACPLCRMALVPSDPLDVREYGLDMTTVPPSPPAGRPFQLRLIVRDLDTSAVVREFAVVHEKLYHLFVVSQDLEHYAHLHPEQENDGSFVLDLALPRAGYYKVYSDFLPAGGTPQVFGQVLVTTGFSGDLASSAARLVPDRVLKKTIAGMSVELQLPADGLIAGRTETFIYRMTDARTGAPVTDLEPYLGAWGHSLALSDDTVSVVHAHPTELLPETGAATGGGPVLTFKGLLPKAGGYRIWTQLKRGGTVFTVPFTVAVASSSPVVR